MSGEIKTIFLITEHDSKHRRKCRFSSSNISLYGQSIAAENATFQKSVETHVCEKKSHY